MTRSNHLLSASTFHICAAVALAACQLPGKLGDLPIESASAGDDSSGDPTTSGDVEETDGAAQCGEGGAAGELAWSYERDKLPGFVSGLAVGPGGEVLAVGAWGQPTDRDVYINKYGPDGAQQWDREYGGVNGLMDTPLAVAVDAAGFVHVLVQETLALDEGPDFSFADARLVVLRITPDGTQVWRWEHTTLPFATGESYVPIGDIGVVDDRIVVLEHNYDKPTLRLELDAAGQLLDESEVAVPPGMDVERLAVDADGSANLAGDFEQNGTHGLWLGRFTPAGALAWSDQFGSLDDELELVLPDGEGGAYFAWRTYLLGGTSEHRLRRYGPDGAVAWTTLTPASEGDLTVMDGAVRCGGTLLLTGSFDLPETPDHDLWIARYGGDGTRQWQLEQAFGPPLGFREGVKIAATPTGDAVIGGNLLDEDPEPTFHPWLARFGGG